MFILFFKNLIKTTYALHALAYRSPRNCTDNLGIIKNLIHCQIIQEILHRLIRISFE